MEIARTRGEEYYNCHRHLYWLSLVVTVSFLCSLSLATTAITSVCPTDMPQSTVAATDRDQFFLNIDHPIECNGTVVAWKICYYLPSAVNGEDDFDETLFAVTVGVWRISRSGGWYWLVDFKPIEELGMDLESGFNCIIYPAQQFDVESGDLVGFHTHNADLPKEVLELRAMTSTGEKLTKRMDSGPCQFAYPGLPVSLSCFENVTGTMHVHVMVEEFRDNEEPTSSTSTSSYPLPSTTSEDEQMQLTTIIASSSDLINQQQTTTMIDSPLDEILQTITLDKASASSSTSFAATTSNLPNQNGINDSAAGMRNRTVIATAVSIGGLILISVILILIVVITIVVMKYRQQSKLLNFKIKKDEHRHIGLDHFVIVSDMSAVPPGSIVSSPISLEFHPCEESRTSKDGISMLKNPHVSTSSALSNPIYGVDDSSIYHTISSGENEYEDPDENGRNCASYEVPIESGTGAKGKVSIRKRSVVNAEHATVITNRNTIDSEVENEQTRYSRTSHSQALTKAILEPQRYSVLYQHYYKVLEEGNTEDKEEKFMAPATNMEDLYAQVHKQKIKELSDKDIKMLELLGSGQFGNVSRGTWKSPKGVIEVAVKTLITKEKKVSRVKLLQEAAIMGQFFHPNVIKLLGVVTKKDSLMLVIELASKGDLKKLLIAMLPDPGELLAPDSDKLLLGYCQQVAFGMHYLGTKGFVHRDLAARNILITHDNILKIADFGMSRDLADESYYISQGGKVPVKWTAPEAIHYLKYSTASDVWSYGCLLYEIWSLGQAPFTDCSNSEALDKLQTGHPEAQVRPSFKDVLLELHGQEDVVLKIPERDADSHKLANHVGGPLEAGEKMYTDLQWKYFTSDDYEEQV